MKKKKIKKTLPAKEISEDIAFQAQSAPSEARVIYRDKFRRPLGSVAKRMKRGKNNAN